LVLGQRLQKMRFGVTDDLHALVGKVFRETRQRQTRTVDGRLPDQPMQPVGTGQQSQLQIVRLIGVKAFYGDNVVLHVSHIKIRPEINLPRLRVVGQKFSRAFDQHLSFVNDVTSVNQL